MYLKSMSLVNWGPYRGEHHVDLEPTVYAVQASLEADPERSNWVGKSWFLGAIWFLLTGEKPEGCTHEDDWITWGEKLGEVSGELSDGTIIERTRTMGKSTRLKVTLQGVLEANQVEAQGSIYGLIGMNAEDLGATSFLKQGEIARLVKEDPSVRTGIVTAWLELGSLEAAQAWLQAAFNKLLKDERELPQVKAQDDAVYVQTEDAETDCQQEVKLLEAEVERRENQLAELATHVRHEQRNDRFKTLESRGLQAREELDTLEAGHPYNTPGGMAGELHMAKAALDEVMLGRGMAAERLEQLREIQAGDWNGVCPKMCEECPVASDVRRVGRTNEKKVRELEAELDERVATLDVKRDLLEDLQRKGRQHAQLEAELKRLREECTGLFDSVDYVEEHGPAPNQLELKTELGLARQELADVRSELSQLSTSLEEMVRDAAQASEVAETRATLVAGIQTHREALAVLKGTHREIAEGALEAIQRGANSLLQAAGIDLVVEVSWARDGKKLATHCDACGTAYPKSQAVKACAVCGEARGPHQVEKLYILPNDRSGAADDIAGLAFQLAASSWLRVKRSAQWAVACIDEPFGALDRANSKVLSSHLHALIRGSYAFEQGFVIAHDSSIMEALPARVQITGTEAGSKLEVL